MYDFTPVQAWNLLICSKGSRMTTILVQVLPKLEGKLQPTCDTSGNNMVLVGNESLRQRILSGEIVAQEMEILWHLDISLAA